MTQAPEDPRGEQPCDERIETLAEEVGREIAKAWTGQEDEGEALARIDEIVASAAGAPEPEATPISAEEARRLRGQVRSWRAPTRPKAERPAPAKDREARPDGGATRLQGKLERGLRRIQPFPGSD